MRQVYMDTETGGLDPKVHGLTEVAMVCFELDPKNPMESEIIEQKHERVNFNLHMAYCPIALDMQDRDFNDNLNAGNESLVVSNILHFLQKNLGPFEVKGAYRSKLIAQYAEFDWGFIRALFERNGFKDLGDGCALFDSRCDWICTRHLFRFLRAIGVHDCEKDSLKNILTYYGIERPDSMLEHSALADALMGIEAYKHMLRDLNDFYGGTR